MLVVRAGSKAGKTEFCKSLFGTVWEQVIEDLAAPNFRTFNPDKADAILLDNVNSADFLLNNRGLLMARNTVHQLAQTATGPFTYPCYLHKIPIMITMDVEKPWPSDSNWLQENCVVIVVQPGEKLYLTADGAELPGAPRANTSTPQMAADTDYVNLLNTWAQQRKTPMRFTFTSEGPLHAATWQCCVQVGALSWTACGERSKKSAKRAAAIVAWREIQRQ